MMLVRRSRASVPDEHLDVCSRPRMQLTKLGVRPAEVDDRGDQRFAVYLPEAKKRSSAPVKSLRL